MKYKIVFIIILITKCLLVEATEKYTLSDCENLFVKKNLLLLAEQYNIEASRAAVLQAKLWEMPYLSGELNFYNPDRSRFLDVGNDGQKSFAVQQIIHIGGQKVNEIALAKKNLEIAELQFQALLRELKYQLRVNYFVMYYDQNSISMIDSQLRHIDTIISRYQVQVDKGNIPLNQLVRLQTLQMELKGNKIQFQNEYLEAKKTIQILISQTDEFSIAPSVSERNSYQKEMSIPLIELQESARKNRIDNLIAEKSAEAGYLNYKWQRSLAIHDLSAGFGYDQRGGAFNNQIGLTFGIPLPLWNRNKGNIKIANAQYQQLVAKSQLQKQSTESEVYSAYQNYQLAKSNFKDIHASLKENLNSVYIGIMDNFRKGNLSIIEFTDFIESYNATQIQINEIGKLLTKNCEELNYKTGLKIF
jgi:cobalt-zinc-cadmium efflux system outer membrane protein